MVEIKKLTELTSSQKVAALSQVEDIFFISSSIKEFSSSERKAAFYKRWCSDYQAYFSNEFFIVLENDKVMGYLSGCSDSTNAANVVEIPGFLVFQDLFKKFPAHLHINFHPDARGKGLGSVLVNHYLSYLRDTGVAGVHLVTSPGVQNVSFYERLKFSFHETRQLNGMDLYFMGQILE